MLVKFLNIFGHSGLILVHVKHLSGSLKHTYPELPRAVQEVPGGLLTPCPELQPLEDTALLLLGKLITASVKCKLWGLLWLHLGLNGFLYFALSLWQWCHVLRLRFELNLCPKQLCCPDNSEQCPGNSEHLSSLLSASRAAQQPWKTLQNSELSFGWWRVWMGNNMRNSWGHLVFSAGEGRLRSKLPGGCSSNLCSLGQGQHTGDGWSWA